MTKQKDWTRQVVRRFQEGISVEVLCKTFQEPTAVIEGILRRTLQAQDAKGAR